MTAIAADPSLRHVLADDAPYLRNLAALWATEPELARRLEAIDDRPSYPVQPSRAGPPTVSVPTPSGRSVWLHSRYEPMDEAGRLMDGLDTEANAVFYIHGFGLGYHVERLFERAGDEAILFVFEPDLLLLRTAFEQRDYSKLIESGRVTILTGSEGTPDKGELLARLTPHTAMVSLGAASVVHGPSEQLHPSFHAQLRQWTDEFASFTRTSINTVLLNSTRTAENIARNVGWYAASPCISRLANRFAGRPAIIVSAGPSLRKNKHLLHEANGRAVIIAVQTMLKPLLEMGIEPHFVTSLDYHDICTRFYENLPPGVRTEMVAEPKATSAIFAMNPGPLSLLGNDYAEGLLREMKLKRTTLRAGATVAHLAFYLAEHLGCDPIIFIGQDLGFSDGLCYAPGTSYEDVWRPELGRFCSVEMKQWDQIVRERFILRRIPDHQGRPMYTEERLFTYLQQFERDFLASTRTIIDATEGGAAKRGTTAMTFRDAIDRHCREPLEARLDDHPGHDWTRIGECERSLLRRREEAAEVAQIGHETQELLEEIREHLSDQPRVNRAISRIDALRVRMNELGATYDLIAQLDQRAQLDRFQADRKLAAAAMLDPFERQRRQVERDIANVRAMTEAAGRFQDLMDDVIASLELGTPLARKGAA